MMINTSWEDVERRIAIDDELKHDERVSRHEIKVKDGRVTFRDHEHDYNDHSLGQMCARTGIPASYASKIKARNVRLFDDIMNDGIKYVPSETGYLVRTRKYRHEDEKHGVARAILSNDYTIYNNADFVSLFLGILSSNELRGRHTLRSFSLDENGMWGKVLFDDLRAWDPSSRSTELKVGIVIGNSEIGNRNVTLRPFVYRKACTNDLVVVSDGDLEQRHIHVNRSELLRRAQYAINRALEKGDDLLQRFVKAYDEKVESPLKVIEKLLKGAHYDKKVQEAAKAAYLTEPHPTKFGVLNALTAAARDLQPDDRVGLETLAGDTLVAWPKAR